MEKAINRGETDNKKQTVVDTSSIIILFKTGLFNLLIDEYHLIITNSVYDELTIDHHTGSKEFKDYCDSGKIKVHLLTDEESKSCNLKNVHPSLDKGEQDTICLFQNGIGDFIIIDDGKGAKFCRDQKIPYINALLFPRILYFGGKCSKSQFNRLIEKIIGIGRYSQEIIDFALNCHKDHLEFFMNERLR